MCAALLGGGLERAHRLIDALGGGWWQIRAGQDFVSEETRAMMRERTDWVGLLDPEAVEDIPPPNEARETLRSSDW